MHQKRIHVPVLRSCTLVFRFQVEQKDGFLIFNQPVKTGDSMPPHCSELLNYPFAPFLSRLNLTPLTAWGARAEALGIFVWPIGTLLETLKMQGTLCPNFLLYSFAISLLDKQGLLFFTPYIIQLFYLTKNMLCASKLKGQHQLGD